MTHKADFNAEEWSTVVDAPLYAGMLVIAADRGGTLRESLALGRAYQAAREGHTGELIEELVKAPPSIDPERLRQEGGDLATVAQERLRAAVGILSGKAAPEEVDSYKTFVMTVAQTVAAAHKEGGLLGIGGKAVSDAENRALDEISAALGAPPATGAASD